MTTQSDILADERARPVLDHGFVRLVDYMGTDTAIAEAARVSYGAGTKTVREDRGLVRYLLRHRHTTPYEQCVVKLHLKMPIFIARQWFRHRSASPNEYSGRYSIMSDEFYLPEPEVLKPQSTDNKQGRAGHIDTISTSGVRWLMQAVHEQTYAIYLALLGERRADTPHNPYAADDPLLTEAYPGIARELARTVLPVANYTEFYWTQNLWNLMHLLKLRLDEHAQYEIRVYADAIYELLKPLFPMALEAFDDYVLRGYTVSRMEGELIKEMMHGADLNALVAASGGLKPFAEHRGMSVREVLDFAATWDMRLEQ